MFKRIEIISTIDEAYTGFKIRHLWWLITNRLPKD